MNKVKGFVKRETVLSAAVILAILSAMVIRPDREYGSYIDYKTIGLLFCLMTVMAGLQSLGVFKKAGERLLGYVKGPGAVSAVLVFLCFFFSMAITNDVALITFVPFAIAVLKMAGMEPLVLPVVVLQTIAANLGSMLTPVGNPQNLYLYSKAGLNAGRFMELMAPYTAVSFGMLVLCLAVVAAGNRMPGKERNGRGQGAYGQRVFPDFHRKQRVWRRSGKRDLLRPVRPVSVPLSAQPGVCGPHSSVAASAGRCDNRGVDCRQEPVSGSGLFPPPDVLRIFCIYRQYGKGAGFLPVPGPDSGRAGKSSPVWAPARLSAMCLPPFCCPDFPGTTVP